MMNCDRSEEDICQAETQAKHKQRDHFRRNTYPHKSNKLAKVRYPQNRFDVSDNSILLLQKTKSVESQTLTRNDFSGPSDESPSDRSEKTTLHFTSHHRPLSWTGPYSDFDHFQERIQDNEICEKYVVRNPMFLDNGDARSVSFVNSSRNMRETKSDSRQPVLKNKCEKVLCFISLLTGILLAVCLVIILLYSPGVVKQNPGVPTPNEKRMERKVCTSGRCVEVAGRILSYLDQSVDPCADFYSFACGGFMKNTFYDPHVGTVDSSTERSNTIAWFFKEQLESGIRTNDPGVFRKAQMFYLSCTDHITRHNREAQPIVGIINKNGGMPLLGTESTPPLSITDLLARIHLLGVNPLFSIHVPESTTSFVIGEPDSFYIPRSVISENQHQNQKYNESVYAIKRSADILTKRDTDLEAATKHLNFGIVLKRSIERYTSLDMTAPSEFTLEEMEDKFSKEIQWKALFKILLEPYAPANLNDFVIKVKNHLYLRNLMLIISREKRRDNFRSLRDYVWLLFAFHNSRLLEAKRQPPTSWNNNPLSTWETCMNELMAGEPGFKLAMESLFIRRYLPSRIDTRHEIDGMVEAIRTSVINLIQAKVWLDKETKDRSIEKLEKMSKRILYPEAVVNDTFLDGYYESIVLRRDKYFENHMSLVKWQMRAEYHKAVTVFKTVSWTDAIFDKNAFYIPAINEFAILAAMVDTPYFETSVPKYINYAGIGVVIAHEMIHGFDTIGMQFDPEGINSDWWSIESVLQFEDRAKCFIDQYGNMSLSFPNRQRTLRVDGIKTLAENIADNGGLRAAYEAWLYYDRVHTDPNLPGLEPEITAEQVFFISLAQTHCSKSSYEVLENTFLNDLHTPETLRVRGFMMNSFAFAKAFQCRESSLMNPTDKCLIW